MCRLQWYIFFAPRKASHLIRIGRILNRMVGHNSISGISKVSLTCFTISEMDSQGRTTLPTISIIRCRAGPHNSISIEDFLSALKKPRQTNVSIDSTTNCTSVKATPQDDRLHTQVTRSTVGFGKPTKSSSLAASGSFRDDACSQSLPEDIAKSC